MHDTTIKKCKKNNNFCCITKQAFIVGPMCHFIVPFLLRCLGSWPRDYFHAAYELDPSECPVMISCPK